MAMVITVASMGSIAHADRELSYGQLRLAALATACDIISPDAPPEQAVTALMTWLNSSIGGNRLIVFDNVERFDDLTGLLPRGNVRVILISPTSKSTVGGVLRVSGFTRPQSIQYLLATTGLDLPYSNRRAAVAAAAAQLTAIAEQPHSAPLSGSGAALQTVGRVGISANELGDPYTLMALGRYVDISNRVLGPDHPDTLIKRNNLAVAYLAVEI
ncbi:hypothetical protein ACLQ2Q_15630 [Microbacterium sp. DT81.1]|uniref:hypothetical protein n=1 Tax=Microbacterium sp. DT81.1 TaxID=3393413 RepID=UPI003CE71EE1